MFFVSTKVLLEKRLNVPLIFRDENLRDKSFRSHRLFQSHHVISKYFCPPCDIKHIIYSTRFIYYNEISFSQNGIPFGSYNFFNLNLFIK